MRIPDAKIDDIRIASDIVDVISSYTALKKRGKSFLGLCPFHQEKTPSFNVSPEKQMYHCFGCGAGGNVFTFVMEYEKVSFIEAVRTLAEKVGIALPTEGVDDRAVATENEALYNACKMAGVFFHDNLLKTIEGKLALEYLRHRGFSDDTIRRFGLGYAMNSWDALIRFGEREGLDLTTLEKAGLVLKREDGSGCYDRFRGRVMFPIFTATGRTAGFGARKLREDDLLGKYINSPETPIYDKSRILYGLSLAKEAIREKGFAILVEGYADLISVFQAGIENVVASSGTALTEEQIRLVGRYAKTITLVYDADSAGSKATIRGVDLILENGLEVRVAELPVGEDPDSFIRKQGGGTFQKLLDGSVSFLDFKATLFRAEGLLDNPEGKARAVRSIVESIAKMKDELKRNFYLKSVAEKYDIYETVLFRELEKVLGQGKLRTQFERRQEEGGAQQGPEPTRARKAEVEPATIPAAERDLLKVMLESGPSMVGSVFSQISADMFRHPDARNIVEVILRKGESDWDLNALLDDVEDTHLKHLIADIVFNKYEISKGWAHLGSELREADVQEVAGQAIVSLRRREIDLLIAGAYQQMKTAVARGEDVLRYQQQIIELQREKKELRTMRLGERSG